MELYDARNPLIALEIKQHTIQGDKSISRSAVFFRILLNVLLLPAALIGFVPLLFGKASLPELITGIRLNATDRRLDPRPVSVIDSVTKKAAFRIRTLTIVPMAAAVAAFFLLHSAPSVMMLQTESPEESLPIHEQELLTHYLELIIQHPDELEYHVRLASLYHRNNMIEDLNNELNIIQTIDSTHAILLLADTTVFSFEMLEPIPEDSSSLPIIPDRVNVVVEATADSTEADSTSSDSLLMVTDSLVTDTLITISADTTILNTDSLEVTVPDSISVPAQVEEIEIPEEITDPAIDIIQEPEEVTVEPDTIIQP